MSPLARWCYRHRFVVLSTWALALVVLVIVGSAAKTSYNSSFVVPGTGSAKAIGLLQERHHGLRAGELHRAGQ